MTRIFAACLAFTVSMCVLTACDNKAAPAVVTQPVTVAEPPPPPKPFNATDALAAVDQKALCVFFSRAMSDAKTKVARSDCAVSIIGSEIIVTTKDGSSSLPVSLAEPAKTVQLTVSNASPRAVVDEQRGAFSNVGAVFIGKAPESGLCLSVEYFAPDGGANSLFVSSDPAAEPIKLEVGISRDGLLTKEFAEPVVPAGQVGAFAVTRREAGMAVKSISFRAC